MNDRNSISLHKGHSAIFIHGMGGTKNTGIKQAAILSGWIYQHPPAAKSRIETIENKAKIPQEINGESRSEILSHLTNDFMLQSTGEIRLVIFCHSNGAKVAKSALESLQGAVKEAHPKREHEFESLTATIRSNVAVVAFGGVSLIPDDLAKLVFNFRFVDDHFSKICHYIRIGDHKAPNSYFRTPEIPEQKQQLSGSIFVMSLDSLTSGVLASSQAVTTLLSQTSLKGLWKKIYSSDNVHFFEKYLESVEMINYIIEKLGLENQYKP